MNYEKAHKAALKTATQWIKDGCSVGEQTCFECVFPELRESEDEKIRKFLIDYFTSYKIGNVATKLNGYRIDDILAYLEKQKINTEGDFGRGYDCGYEACLNSHGAEWFEKQKHPNGCFTCDEYKKGYEEGRRNGFTAGYNKAMKEVEQKEQKPAEWSEEDDEMLEYIIGDVKDAEQLYTTTQAAKDMANKEIAWLKSLRSRPKSSDNWKPSEEQMDAKMMKEGGECL